MATTVRVPRPLPATTLWVEPESRGMTGELSPPTVTICNKYQKRKMFKTDHLIPTVCTVEHPNDLFPISGLLLQCVRAHTVDGTVFGTCNQF